MLTGWGTPKFRIAPAYGGVTDPALAGSGVEKPSEEKHIPQWKEYVTQGHIRNLSWAAGLVYKGFMQSRRLALIK